MTSLAFHEVGAQLFRGALLPHLTELETATAHFANDDVGIRIYQAEKLHSMLATTGCIGAIAASILGEASRPVRAVFFNKTPQTNWSLAWHQDRTICVKEKREASGFGTWTIKQGMIHVAPPVEILEGMVTIRAHIDNVPSTNAPLLIAPGSHRVGMVPTHRIDDVVQQCGTTACLAAAGDVWLYSTLILHASEAATVPSKRRVLQVDYSASDLPGGLQWQGV